MLRVLDTRGFWNFWPQSGYGWRSRRRRGLRRGRKKMQSMGVEGSMETRVMPKRKIAAPIVWDAANQYLFKIRLWVGALDWRTMKTTCHRRRVALFVCPKSHETPASTMLQPRGCSSRIRNMVVKSIQAGALPSSVAPVKKTLYYPN
jgi:hypothetical protein